MEKNLGDCYSFYNDPACRSTGENRFYACLRLTLRFLMRLLIRLVPLALSLTVLSCSSTGSDMARFHEDGRAKPAVAVASMIDTTSFEAPWSLSEEFTSNIINRIAQKGTIYVSAKDDLSYTENPFTGDLSWMKFEFPDHEFAVFLELVEHDNVPVAKNKKKVAEVPFETSISLKMAAKLRVVDLRGAAPKVVLQELVRDSYFIPKTMVPTDYSTVMWGCDDYNHSPMGLAHAEFVQEIANRVSEYIHLAKSR